MSHQLDSVRSCPRPGWLTRAFEVLENISSVVTLLSSSEKTSVSFSSIISEPINAPWLIELSLKSLHLFENSIWVASSGLQRSCTTWAEAAHQADSWTHAGTGFCEVYTQSLGALGVPTEDFSENQAHFINFKLSAVCNSIRLCFQQKFSSSQKYLFSFCSKVFLFLVFG